MNTTRTPALRGPQLVPMRGAPLQLPPFADLERTGPFARRPPTRQGASTPASVLPTAGLDLPGPHRSVTPRPAQAPGYDEGTAMEAALAASRHDAQYFAQNPTATAGAGSSVQPATGSYATGFPHASSLSAISRQYPLPSVASSSTSRVPMSTPVAAVLTGDRPTAQQYRQLTTDEQGNRIRNTRGGFLTVNAQRQRERDRRLATDADGNHIPDGRGGFLTVNAQRQREARQRKAATGQDS